MTQSPLAAVCAGVPADVFRWASGRNIGGVRRIGFQIRIVERLSIRLGDGKWLFRQRILEG
jgi:hypothetical protein